MSNLPKKFPEYSIMCKTLSNQIKLLGKRTKNAEEGELKEIMQRLKTIN
jgi:hypothetical protein